MCNLSLRETTVTDLPWSLYYYKPTVMLRLLKNLIYMWTCESVLFLLLFSLLVCVFFYFSFITIYFFPLSLRLSTFLIKLSTPFSILCIKIFLFFYWIKLYCSSKKEKLEIKYSQISLQPQLAKRLKKNKDPINWLS